MHIFIYNFVLVLVVPFVFSWNLRSAGIEDNYYVSSIAMYRNRVFLALPRDACSNNITQPTAVEVTWNDEDNSNIFSGKRNLFTGKQTWGQCKELQNAIAMQMDPSKKPKLWLLDKGNHEASCAPKVLTYHLYHNTIAQSCDLDGVPYGNLHSFIIDPVVGDFGPKGYIGDAGDGSLIVLSLNELKWWRLHLSNKEHFVQPYSLAVSKVDDRLFITGENSVGVFAMDLEKMRGNEGPLAVEAKSTTMELPVDYLGDKLGVSSGFEADSKGGLSYFLVRDFAIVRWEIGQPMDAEHHNVLAQSYKTLPFVSELFTGPQNGIWALVNPTNSRDCQHEDIPARVVKILKFNKFFS